MCSRFADGMFKMKLGRMMKLFLSIVTTTNKRAKKAEKSMLKQGFEAKQRNILIKSSAADLIYFYIFSFDVHISRIVRST